MAEEIASREKKTLSQLFVEFAEKLSTEHGDGNPAYQLDKWVENPEFLATPAFFAPPSVIYKYLDSIKNRSEHLKHDSQTMVWAKGCNKNSKKFPV